jgi:pyruvate/2-oxoglutarate dehydrogenase complex dihydrolipoamide acyltransferase (E2) component
MGATIIMPQLGETVAEGKILAWFKSVGDEVRRGDNLFEVETDKVTVEVQSIVAGRLSEIRVGPGVTAKVGDIVALVSDDAAAEPPVQREAPNAPRSRSPLDEVSTPLTRFGPAKGLNGVHFTPLARRLVLQRGLDLGKLAADAERRGVRKVHAAAVRAAAERPAASPALADLPAQSPPPAPNPVREGDVVTLNAVRRRTGQRIAENWRSIPHVFQAIEVDFTALDVVRRRAKAAFEATDGFSLTFLPFIARATCLAIAAYPEINARFEGEALALSREINLGFAVDLDHNGLVAPVVHGAGELTVAGLARAIRRQVEKAKAGKLSPDDLSGATYSITNNGAFGVSFTAPIINAPQVAILSVDAIRLKPWVVSTDSGDFVAPRMIGVVGQSFDHRAFDGAYSAAFLSRLKQILETRAWDEEFPSGP